MVFSGDPQRSYSMPPWCHLGSFALSLGSHLGASSKSSSFIFWAILVFSGGPPCLYSMPLWSHHGHLPPFFIHLIGLLWGPPMILLHASLVPSWQSCFFFEYQCLCQIQVLLFLLLCHLGLLWRSPMPVLYATLVSSWQSGFIFE